MILVDKNIKSLAEKIIIKGYDENNVGPVSYDVTIQSIICENEDKDMFVLRPQEMIFIKTMEKIKMPNNLMGRIGEKNSRMRQGLFVSGPHYFPGHETYMFLRVVNLSSNSITISKGDKIAQIFFEELKQEPEQNYASNPNASFNNENEYRGLGKYESEYEKRVSKIEELNETLEKKENSVYLNIITFMGLFVSIFSLITINFSQLTNNFSSENIIPINISLGVVIALFMGLILIFLNKAKSKLFLGSYIALFGVLIVLTCYIL
ncbi:dCTP deaminase domain-containing protein [Faecalitalea cylindroides]|uniref:dCTP deaminase n=1 Tax=Faecalitalea cylindroides TaxID=39483 RepID=UPI00232EBE0F|nr:hypothetical protein [Faecalitalea cylindroides]MDB7951536.1 hypothetical protein [Faecalitalea cylindroides]MDB7958381.1 hypothetical protein [Faecalitalea cylindroides]MDB7960439.1 hypothetical protein [Faecalitalea cylindroides]MDB7962309.1 hypothetical protein [Faecalitalea cylindroides]MDB7964180.1 hypothetical protein [Faecalitalea cylindroides]